MDYVVSSGTLPNVTLNAGDTMSVFDSGTAVSTTVDFSAIQLVYNGGTASDTVVDGGELYVSGGTTFNGSSIFNTATSYDADASSGYIVVPYGGVTSGTVLGGTGGEVLSGGESYYTTVNAGGTMNVEEGGEFYTVINKGGSDFIQGSGTNFFGSSYGPGSATSDTINAGSQTVSGSAIDTLVENGGQQNVYGTVTDTTVLSGGIQTVYGAAYNTNVGDGGTINVYDFSNSYNTMVSGGGTETVIGAVVSDTTLKPGADAMIYKGGTDFEGKIDFGASESILFSGYADSVTVSDGGLLAVASGGSAFGTDFMKGSILVIAPGSKVSGSEGDPTVVKQGVVVQSPIAGPKVYTTSAKSLKIAETGSAFVLPSGTAISATDNGIMTVYSGGTAIDTKISGTMTVLSGGVESGSMVGSGGHETISGATTYYDTVGSGGIETVAATVDALGHSVGGTSSVTIAGGTLDIDYGAKVLGVVTFTGSGGVFEDENNAVPTNVFSGFVAGDEIVLPNSVPYHPSATVAVTTPGVVTIHSDNHGYNLNIAGATVGETDFAFGPGSILTKTAAPATMTFLRPSPLAVDGGGAENWFDASRPAVMAAPVATVAAPDAGGRAGAGGWLGQDGFSTAFTAPAPVVSHTG